MKKIVTFLSLMSISLSSFASTGVTDQTTSYVGKLTIAADDEGLLKNSNLCQLTIKENVDGSSQYSLSSGQWKYSIYLPKIAVSKIINKEQFEATFTTQNPSTSIELENRAAAINQSFNLHQRAYVSLEKQLSNSVINEYFSYYLPEIIANDKLKSVIFIFDNWQAFVDEKDPRKLKSIAFEHQEGINGSGINQMVDFGNLDLEKILKFNNKQKLECIDLVKQ